ncbi:hypothetical protein A3Q56_03142 [Intoshia linei]|uniref:Sulfotransferase domain-containing protein n=1 Tax=Intoshia linei TaxID=1819745 RepID=A0A177B6R3_9BILA|nr:hypothetical protein A3Q56_03142 [Intoshia linei]
MPGQYVYEGVAYPGHVPKDSILNIKNLNLTKEDIIVDTYPKCGTALILNIVSLLKKNDRNEENYTTNKDTQMINNYYCFEIEIDEISNFEKISKAKSPRIIKTHLRPLHIKTVIEKHEMKVIYGMRNVKDVLVSFYNFYKQSKLHGPFTGNWNEWYQLYKSKNLVYGDYFNHVNEWLKYSENNQNIYLVNYENILENMTVEIERIAKFLNVNVTTSIIIKIEQECSFDSMKENFSKQMSKTIGVNSYFRQGKIGKWKEIIKVNQSEEIDERIKNELKINN